MIPIILTKDTIREVLDCNGSFDVFIPILFETALESLLRTGEGAPGYTTDRLRNIIFLAEAIIADRTTTFT